MIIPKRHCPWVIALLSITIAARGSLSTDPTTNHQDPPFWQFILREYVFKTISSTGYQDDDLHKKILNAAFYGDSLLVAPNDVNAVVSVGKVYNIHDGQWILCQDGCTKCELCDWQKGDPVVKWTLRRVKRLTSTGLPKWGLRLTVVPQMDESFYISKHPPRWNDNYVMHQDTNGAESSQKLVSSSQQAVSYDKSTEPKFWDQNRAKLYSGSEWSNDESNNDHRRNLVQAKSYGSLRHSPLTYYDVDQDINEEGSPVESSQDDRIPRLIVGIDQHGNKHLVHLVPVDPLVNPPDQSNNYASTSYRRSYRQGNPARISRTIQRDRDGSTYEKMIAKVLESFNTHRNFIEEFLFADRLESVDHNEGAPQYSSYAGSPDEKFQGGNLESYRYDDSRPANQYPTGSEYQPDEQGEHLRRYPVMTQEVNKPYGEYQDQNSMIEYGPYGVSAQNQEQHQDERSLPLVNVDRKRHNSFGKLTDSTFGREAYTQNQTDTSDIEFSMRRDFLQNSANQALVNLAVKSNETDARIRKLPEADFEMQTFGSDD